MGTYQIKSYAKSKVLYKQNSLISNLKSDFVT